MLIILKLDVSTGRFWGEWPTFEVSFKSEKIEHWKCPFLKEISATPK